ncbi:transporter substrate-binding protein [Stappia sp. BW2]|uniref:transporter substrate-binding domain-containing protein n=1 Tax=Stappia sp. BW2 TaxID=2592622 RepID=UPI0011DEAD00|nr:transporter substrate-binding domain-containing protein [Stappia sp. BW2]TYC79744.1 transporter substrate-binding protein [Stappia sp. BW2]
MAFGEIPVGVLFSKSGSYAAIGQEGYWGARIAIDEINASGLFDFRFLRVDGDPRGSTENYAVEAERMMREAGCRHIVGTQTSSSRKEVLPVMERGRGLLWYTTPYEGFESHDRVVYTGACPNQGVVPLFRHIVPESGRRAFLLGSNYIWGWETNRIARELLAGCNGDVLGERYVAIGDENIDHLIVEIREKRPDFIFNNLIGESSYAFLRAMKRLAKEDPAFAPNRCPILSCNLTEAELPILGAAAEGLVSTSTYFETLDTPENEDFLSRLEGLRGPEASISSMFVGPYEAVWLLARAIEACGSDAPDHVLSELCRRPHRTPLRDIRIDPQTQHAYLQPLIAVVETTGPERLRSRFRIIEKTSGPLAPDPYLVHYDPLESGAGASGDAPVPDNGNAPGLRLVSS